MQKRGGRLGPSSRKKRVPAVAEKKKKKGPNKARDVGRKKKVEQGGGRKNVLKSEGKKSTDVTLPKKKK